MEEERKSYYLKGTECGREGEELWFGGEGVLSRKVGVTS